jgi:hypothetical protein
MQSLKQQPYYVVVDTPNARLGRRIFYAIAILAGAILLWAIGSDPSWFIYCFFSNKPDKYRTSTSLSVPENPTPILQPIAPRAELVDETGAKLPTTLETQWQH